MKQDIIIGLLGGQQPSQFLVNILFALIGVVLTMLLSTTFRDIDSKRTPVEFSWSFFLQDNIKRLIAGIIMIFLALRFTPDIFGVQLSNWLAVIIGLINDSLALLIRNKVREFKSKL